MPSDELHTLREAAEGLLYPSETDAPFEVFCWDSAGTAEEQVAQHTGRRPTETWTLARFFGELEDTDDAARFRHLRQAIESTLTSPQVLRTGTRRIEIHLIGRLPDGRWAGLKTLSVET